MTKEKIKKKVNNLNKKVAQKTAGYILTAFGLVAGLAWNDAIRSAIEYFFPLQKDGLLAKFIYALVFTVIVVVIGIYVAKILEKHDDKKQQKKRQEMTNNRQLNKIKKNRKP